MPLYKSQDHYAAQRRLERAVKTGVLSIGDARQLCADFGLTEPDDVFRMNKPQLNRLNKRLDKAFKLAERESKQFAEAGV